ncbi:MAG: rhodanese-like domain-containing protein [Bacilli bacterium]
MNEMTAFELNHLLENGEEIVILDVRESYEVAHGKIPGAQHMALGTIPDCWKSLDVSKKYAIICAAGVRSHNACVFLEEKGFNVHNVVDGMYGWRGELEF